MDWLAATFTFLLGLSSALGLEFVRGRIDRRQRLNDRRAAFQLQRLEGIVEPAQELFALVEEKYFYPAQEHWAHTGDWTGLPEDRWLSPSEADKKFGQLKMRLTTEGYLIADRELADALRSS